MGIYFSAEQLRCGTGGVKLLLQQTTLSPVATSVLFALGKGSREMVAPLVATQAAPFSSPQHTSK
jgi:hypothetical protein